VNSSKFLMSTAFVLASSIYSTLPQVEAKDAASMLPPTKVAPQAAPNSGEYELNFPPERALAQILWKREVDANPIDKGNKSAKERVLARGKIRLPKNVLFEVVLLPEALEHMDSIEQLTALPIEHIIAAKLDFTDEHMRHLRNFKGLVHLNLDETLITDKSLPIIGTFRNLMALRLSVTDTTGSNFEALSKLTHILNLNIRGISLKTGSLAKLKGALSHLTDLDMSNINLGKEDAAALVSAPELKMLEIAGNKRFDDSCVGYLAGMKHLKSLNITDTSVTDKSLPELSKLPKLKSITVRARTFWRSGQPGQLKGRLKVIDSFSKSNTTEDMFSPLH
jgi:hypothetical protein